jgi:O-methyltransferase/methyltransferase family protein
MSSMLENWFRQGASELPPSMRIYYLSQGSIITSTLALAAELGIADHLVDGPRSSEELAQATSTHTRSLYRLLRLLCSVGVFTEIKPDSFAQTPLSECLRTGIPGSMRSWLRMIGLKNRQHMQAEGLHSIKTGEPVFERVTGMEFFEYHAAHPEEGEIFNQAMNDIGQGAAEAVVQSYDFSGISKIIDIGGGHGTMIAAILQKYPEMTGILFDLPQVAESARESIASAGLAQRCEIVGGDFLKSVPAGCDAYLLRWVIHDWDHDHAITILRNCRQAMGDRGCRLLLIESVIPEGNELHPGKLLDYIMLLCFGGQERTEGEYDSLLREAGLRLNRVAPTASYVSIIEAVPR